MKKASTWDIPEENAKWWQQQPAEYALALMRKERP